MRELIGGQHDIDFPVTATAQGIQIHRPDELGEEVDDPEPVASADPIPGPSHPQTPPPPPASRPRERQRTSESELITYLRDSDERHNAILRSSYV